MNFLIENAPLSKNKIKEFCESLIENTQKSSELKDQPYKFSAASVDDFSDENLKNFIHRLRNANDPYDFDRFQTELKNYETLIEPEIYNNLQTEIQTRKRSFLLVSWLSELRVERDIDKIDIQSLFYRKKTEFFFGQQFNFPFTISSLYAFLALFDKQSTKKNNVEDNIDDYLIFSDEKKKIKLYLLETHELVRKLCVGTTWCIYTNLDGSTFNSYVFFNQMKRTFYYLEYPSVSNVGYRRAVIHALENGQYKITPLSPNKDLETSKDRLMSMYPKLSVPFKENKIIYRKDNVNHEISRIIQDAIIKTNADNNFKTFSFILDEIQKSPVLLDNKISFSRFLGTYYKRNPPIRKYDLEFISSRSHHEIEIFFRLANPFEVFYKIFSLLNNEFENSIFYKKIGILLNLARRANENPIQSVNETMMSFSNKEIEKDPNSKMCQFLDEYFSTMNYSYFYFLMEEKDSDKYPYFYDRYFRNNFDFRVIQLKKIFDARNSMHNAFQNFSNYASYYFNFGEKSDFFNFVDRIWNKTKNTILSLAALMHGFEKGFSDNAFFNEIFKKIDYHVLVLTYREQFNDVLKENSKIFVEKFRMRLFLFKIRRYFPKINAKLKNIKIDPFSYFCLCFQKDKDLWDFFSLEMEMALKLSKIKNYKEVLDFLDMLTEFSEKQNMEYVKAVKWLVESSSSPAFLFDSLFKTFPEDFQKIVLNRIMEKVKDPKFAGEILSSAEFAREFLLSCARAKYENLLPVHKELSIQILNSDLNNLKEKLFTEPRFHVFLEKLVYENSKKLQKEEPVDKFYHKNLRLVGDENEGRYESEELHVYGNLNLSFNFYVAKTEKITVNKCKIVSFKNFPSFSLNGCSFSETEFPDIFDSQRKFYCQNGVQVFNCRNFSRKFLNEFQAQRLYFNNSIISELNDENLYCKKAELFFCHYLSDKFRVKNCDSLWMFETKFEKEKLNFLNQNYGEIGLENSFLKEISNFSAKSFKFLISNFDEISMIKFSDIFITDEFHLNLKKIEKLEKVYFENVKVSSKADIQLYYKNLHSTPIGKEESVKLLMKRGLELV